MPELFGARLQTRIAAIGPLCLGIDPSAAVLAKWERPDTVEGLEFAVLRALEAASETAAAIKPQVAYFERFGSAGYRVLERLIHEAHEADVLVIADAKRGDIGATNEGYASAWLDDHSPLACDAVTITPYTGVATLAPFLSRVSAGKGLFVLAATSNEEGRSLQEAVTADGERVEDMVLRQVADWNQEAPQLGGVGVVLGATRTPPRFNLAHVRGPFLVPGVGAQGGTPEQVGRLFAQCPKGSVLVNVSRAILNEGPERSGLRDAARRWRDDLAAAL